jgi:hypothetical protein
MHRLSPLLLVTLLGLGVGACNGRSLSKPDGGDGGPQADVNTGDGSPHVDGNTGDGCRYNGVTYAAGASFPSDDGCNSCTCNGSNVGCTKRACLPDAGGTDADAGSAETIACDDGTGATNCCPLSAIVDTACSAEGLTCRTVCLPTLNGGYQSQRFCKGGRWAGGQGLFACGKPVLDGGNDGAGAVCTPGADQTCNDNPVVSSLWGHCEVGVCFCKEGRSINPATGRCRLDPVVDAAASTSN